VQLCTLRYLGYCPDDLVHIPHTVTAYLAKQLAIKAPEALMLQYGQREHTRTDHLQEIVSFVGYAKAKQTDLEELEAWLTERALEHDRPMLLFTLACERLYESKILRPGVTVIERLVVSARHRAQQQTYDEMANILKPETCTFLDEILYVDDSIGRTPLYWLKFGATSNTPGDILNNIEKVEYLRQRHIEEWKVLDLNPNRLKFLAQVGRQSSNQSLQRSVPERRYPILVAFLLRTYEEIIDELIELFDRCLADCYTRAKGDLKRFQLSIAKTTNTKLRIFRDIGQIVLNAEISDSALRAHIYEVIPEIKFRQAVDECDSLIRPNDDQSYDFLSKRYGYIREFSPKLLKIMQFRSHQKNDPLLKAITILNTLNDEHKRKVPDDAPTEFIQKSWRPYIRDEQGQIVRRYYEISTLWSLRGALRSGDVWVNYSRRYADPESYLIPKKLWPSMRKDACRMLGLPESSEQHLKLKQRELEAFYRELDEKIEQGDEVNIENNRLSLTRLSAEELPQSVEDLQDTITQRLPRVDIADLLIEVDQWTQFRDDFKHASQHQASNPQNGQLLYASLLAQANNYGLTKMAEVSGLSYSQLAWFTKWYFREETLQAGINRLVNYHFHLPLSSYWGGGTLSSSDGQRFPVAVKARNATVIPRYGYGRILTFYSWTSDQHSQWRCKPEPSTVRDATYVLDGLLDNETELPLYEHTTDTAGYTEKIFGFFDGLRFLFSPRIRDLSDQQIYCIDKTIEYKHLGPIIKGRINVQHIEKQWDALLHTFASIKLGWVTASLFIHKLQSQPRQSSLAKAVHEYGKLIKSIYIPKYICREEVRRRVSKQLNKGEALHDLRQWLLFADEGQLKRSQLQEQANQASALTLVTNAIIVWNTVYMQAVIDQLKQEGYVINESDLPHISPCRFEHINKHGKLTFNVNTTWRRDFLRPLRDPSGD
jgi:TnpA family transposase